MYNIGLVSESIILKSLAVTFASYPIVYPSTYCILSDYVFYPVWSSTYFLVTRFWSENVTYEVFIGLFIYVPLSSKIIWLDHYCIYN